MITFGAASSLRDSGPHGESSEIRGDAVPAPRPGLAGILSAGKPTIFLRRRRYCISGWLTSLFSHSPSLFFFFFPLCGHMNFAEQT